METTTGEGLIFSLDSVSESPEPLLDFDFYTYVDSSLGSFPNTYTGDGDFSSELKEMINEALASACGEGHDPQERFNLFGEKLSEVEIPSAMTMAENGILQFVVPSTGQLIETDLTMQNGMPVLYPEVE